MAIANDLLELREAAGLSISPDGRYAAYQVRRANAATNSYEAWWEVVALDGGRPAIRIADGGGAPWGRQRRNGRPTMVWITLAARWSPDGDWIAYLKIEDGQVQVWRSRVDGSRTEQITRDAGDVIDFVWSEDGRSIIYLAGPSRADAERAMQDERLDGFLLDDRFDPVVSWEPLRVHGQSPPVCCSVIEPRSRQVRAATTAEVAHYSDSRPLPARMPVAGTMHMWTARAQGTPPPSLAAASGHPPHAQWERRNDDDSSVLLAFADPARLGLMAHVRVYARAPGATVYAQCTQSECAGYITEAWRTSGGDVVYSRSEGYADSQTALYAWSPNADTPPRRLLVTHDRLFDCTQARDRLICFREGTLAPQTLISIDMNSGASTTLVDPNPDYDTASQATAERIEWRSPAGEPVFGYFVRPLGGGAAPYPLVIVQYRARGFLRGGAGDFSPIQAYARAGLAVLVVERPEATDLSQRIVDDYEIERYTWEGHRLRRDVVGALERGIDLLIQRGDVDPNRVGISGLSDGSVTTAYAISHSHRFRAASIAGGSWEPMTYYMSSPQARSFMAQLGIGLPGSEDDRNWDGVSLSRNAAFIETPLLIQTGDRELGAMLQPLVTLQEHDKPVEAYVFSDEYHLIWQPRHRLAMYRRNIDWFRFWLQNFEDPNSPYASQYQRWREMRDRETQSPHH
ncbi:MAG: Atxe2 family lasso peptide isopeptidase [Hyphomonadaceae bacterium]|nr:Atxe2 family lasso peptide isopeptidase [Hyphomonadaceae bacterium]